MAQPEPVNQARPTFDPKARNLPVSANDLVRDVIASQLKQRVEPAYMFRIRKETPAGTQTKELIETSSGRVAWVLEFNDQRLTAEQRQREDEKLQKLLDNREEQEKSFKRQKEDEERTRKMLGAMPDAFLYTYESVEPPRNGSGELVRLSFKANPKFKAPDRETQVYRSMEGHMLVDHQEKHLVKIDAQLIQDVNFGWGIFGRLNKGGRFIVEQSRIAKDRWDITDMELDFTGKVLLFKKLRIKEHQTATAFRPVPQNLSLYEAVQILRHKATELAQKKQF
ncbi:MAG: hypothetical protein L0Z53_04420 [Acidobacteriales bacterium]|nr:hypothetical protein [Terriglobales bacterium]